MLFKVKYVKNDTIMSDKEKFGRVRKYTMKYLRTKYGKKIADRAQWRVNRRRTEGYLTRRN